MTRILARLNESGRSLRWLALALTLWLSTAGAAWAAPKKQEEKAAAPTKSYVASYIIVIFALGLGMMAVIRPSTRTDKVAARSREDAEEE
jgi:cytochrome c biogenesis factor